MVRPQKFRNICFNAKSTFFKPQGIPLKCLEEVIVFHDEIEALRLKYIENLEQITAAEKMQISQSTFQRILYSANKKIAEAIINGKAIKIESE